MKKPVNSSLQLLIAQFTAVFIWFLITVVQWTNNPKSNPGVTIPLIVRGIEAMSIFITSGIAIFLVNRYRNSFKRYAMRLLLLAGLYPVAVITNYLSILIRDIIGFSPPAIDGFFFIHSLHFYLPILLVFSIYYLLKNRIELQSEREDKLLAESRLQQAKWLMLRYQVNPHFLFNALNSIRSLIGNDDDKAREIVTSMSEYFRYSLSIDKKAVVKVCEEMAAVRNYLHIQKSRYTERLSVSENIDKDALEFFVPVFSIQTLVENAIKYGLKTHPDTVIIDINISLTENLVIRISNSGKLSKNNGNYNIDGTGTGLENLISRLHFLDKDSRLTLEEKNQTVVATIIIKPIKNAENPENHNC